MASTQNGDDGGFVVTGKGVQLGEPDGGFNWPGWGRRLQRTTLIFETFLIGLGAALSAQAIAALVRWFCRPLAD